MSPTAMEDSGICGYDRIAVVFSILAPARQPVKGKPPSAVAQRLGLRGILEYAILSNKLSAPPTITLSVMLNFFSVLNGTLKYSADKPQDYHIVLAYLSDSDIGIVKQIPYVENVRIEYINDIRHIYVKLKDADPSAYINKCYEILDKIDAWNKYEYYRGYQGKWT